MNKRNEYFVREDLINCYNQLTDESLSQLTKSQNKKKLSKINKELKILFKEYGRVVLQDEVNSWKS